MLNNERMLLKWIIKKNQTFITNSQRNNIHMDSCTHRQIQHTTITYFKHRRLFLTPADGGRTCRSLQSFAALSYNFAALSYNIVEVKPYVTRAIKMNENHYATTVIMSCLYYIRSPHTNGSWWPWVSYTWTFVFC